VLLLVSLAVAILGLPAASGAVPAQTTVDDLTGLTQPTFAAQPSRPMAVETPYGTIRGDVILPNVPDGTQVPVILTYTPYSVLYHSLDPRRESRADDAVADYFVPRGYARAVFDVVGTYGSSGCTDFGGDGERKTGAAVVDFLGTQPWSNGKVGMIGGSYDGTTAIAAAVEAPEHLVTIVPQVAIDRWYDYMYNDGVRMTLEDNAGGLADPPLNSPLDYDTVYGVVPPYPSLTSDPVGVAGVLADHLNPCNRVENQQRGYQTDPVYDDFWVERDYRALAGNVEASVLLEGAWLDDNVKHWATTRFFSALGDGEGAPHKRMVIGQWSHSASRFPDAQKLRHAWFDYFLKGIDTGVVDLPPVETQGSDGIRRAEVSWPPAGTQDVAYSFTGGAADGSQFGANGMAPSWSDHNPSLTEDLILASRCGDTCARFSAPPVSATTRIVGSPRLTVTASTDATSTHLVPVLIDVAPNGSGKVITRGLLNSNQRDGLNTSKPLTPGAAWSATVELWDTDWTLAKGHRLELVLVSSNATWGLPDETRATTSIDLGATSMSIPLLEMAGS
jgi:X-Pro dipeptidyl-peptidase